jgi:hypothetical protein
VSSAEKLNTCPDETDVEDDGVCDTAVGEDIFDAVLEYIWTV